MMLTANLIIFLAAFASMEFVAWFSHKYVMHGALWNLHRDHHVRDQERVFEHNDFFFLMFALPAIVFLYLGYSPDLMNPLLWIGAGITAYGFAYVFVHDVFVHQRIRVLTRTNNSYLRAMRMAHKVHHKRLTKEDGECFGFLWVSKKYLASAQQSRRSK